MRDSPLVIAAWNVRQGGTNRARQIGEALSASGADVVVIGEYRAGGPLDDELRARGYGHITASRREYGVAVASRFPHAPCDLMEFFRRHDDRFVAVRLEHFTLVGTYFPLKHDKIPLWESILEMARVCKDRPVLLMGDLNSGSHYADEQGASLVAADLFDRLSEFGWVDLWRRQHGEKREFTWFSNHGNGFRLDHAFSSPALAGRVVRCEYSHAERIDRISDHSMQIVELATARGRSSSSDVRPREGEESMVDCYGRVYAQGHSDAMAEAPAEYKGVVSESLVQCVRLATSLDKKALHFLLSSKGIPVDVVDRIVASADISSDDAYFTARR